MNSFQSDVILALSAGFVSTLYDPKQINEPLKFFYQISLQISCTIFVVFILFPIMSNYAGEYIVGMDENGLLLLKAASALSARPIITIFKESTPSIINMIGKGVKNDEKDK